jgi:hypothetical protein
MIRFFFFFFVGSPPKTHKHMQRARLGIKIYGSDKSAILVPEPLSLFNASHVIGNSDVMIHQPETSKVEFDVRWTPDSHRIKAFTSKNIMKTVTSPGHLFDEVE